MNGVFKNIRNFFVPHRGNNGHPHIVRHHTLVPIALIAIATLGGIFALTDPENTTHLSANVYSSVLVDLTNQNRKDQALPPLAKNDKLTTAAKLKAEDMAKKGYFAHVSPEGLNSWYWFQKAGYVFAYAGENLAVDFTESKDVDSAWLASPTHRANIMNAGFTEIGIATVDGVYKGNPSTFVVQMFGTPAKIVAAPIKKPTVTTPKETTAEQVATESQKAVLGATTIAESGDATNTLVVAKNDEVATEQITNVEPIVYTPWYDRLLIELSKPLGIIMLVIGVLLAISLVLSVVYHRKITERALVVTIIVFALFVSGYLYVSIAHNTAFAFQGLL